MPHLLRHCSSMEGFCCGMDLTLLTIAWMESSRPKVACKVTKGSLEKKVAAIVCVPGSELGKDAMN